MRIDFDSIEGYIANHLKLFIAMTVGILVLVGIVALVIFSIAVRGAEQTLVPDIQGKQLTEALLELQEKELYPRIQLRYSQNANDRGQILEQDPLPGTIVKAGRRIRLVVSQGVVISKVDTYIGRDLNEVRMDIQTIDSGLPQPLLSIKEPVMYEFSGQAPGLVIEQKPLPGADISGPLQLEFVVSKGPENTTVTVPRFTGLSISAALKMISSGNINFHFSVRSVRDKEKYETVVDQSPDPDSKVNAGAVVQLTITPPEKLKDGEVFKLFHYAIPLNPYPLSVSLDAVYPSGDRAQIITVNYAGGDFTAPCRVPAGTVLILSMLNREIYRETAAPSAEPLSLDQL
ncbi:MAG: PASTA domain-containing protein [Treponema sp.]|nr:PASTA domain-containing protein [Treponema sp.]